MLLHSYSLDTVKMFYSDAVASGFALQTEGQYVDLQVSKPNSGFLYQNGTFQTINYPGSAGTAAKSINDNSDFVGAYTLPGSTASHGFIYHDGSFLPFDLPNCNVTIPQGINNHGVIVGKTCGGAFIATPMPN